MKWSMAAGIHMCSQLLPAANLCVAYMVLILQAYQMQEYGVMVAATKIPGKPGKVRQKDVTGLEPMQRMTDEVITS